MENKAIFSQIKELIENNDIVIFMKGNASSPLCGFSQMVVQIFNNIGADFKDVNVLEDNEMRQGIKDFTNWPTIPQVYVKEEFIGGCDIVKEMYQSGELLELLKEEGLARG